MVYTYKLFKRVEEKRLPGQRAATSSQGQWPRGLKKGPEVQTWAGSVWAWMLPGPTGLEEAPAGVVSGE